MALKRAVSLCLCCFLTLLSCGNVFAYDMPRNLRVALSSRYNGVSVVPIENKTILVGYELNGVFQGDGIIAASNAFSVVPTNAIYVSQGQNVGSYGQAMQAVNAFLNAGQACAAGFVANGNWQVYFGPFAAVNEADVVRNAYGGVIINSSTKRTALKDGARELIIFDNPNAFPQVADANDGFVTLSDRKYRGSVEFGRYGNGQLTAVNILSPDAYLYSAVPSEMPSSWHLEALKAQSVAARSYTVTRMGIHKDAGYDLCDGVHCQQYLGAGNESPLTTAAVNATSGIMAFYAGKPINATYFSSSGGVTEDGDKVWNDTVPYLKSVKEVAETTSKQWIRSFTLSEITALLEANNVSIGQAVSVSVGSDSVSGRMTFMTVVGTNGSKTFLKDNVRTFFSKSNGGNLESTNFQLINGSVASSDATVAVFGNQATNAVLIKTLYATSSSYNFTPLNECVVIGQNGTFTYPLTQKVAVSGVGNDIVFSGQGWGHGVGMSQYGAKGMAEAGYTYDQILKHYYTGIEVR